MSPTTFERCLVSAGLVSVFAASLAACSDPPPPPPVPPHPAAAPTVASASSRNPGATAPQGPPPPPMTITDQTFVESASVRDPFRSFARDFITNPANSVVETRDVKLRNFTLEDLRLVAVVVGSDAPYAMVVDPSHSGTILRRGMLVGRQEMIHHPDNPGGQDYATHWRVARITAARLRRTGEGTFEEVPAELVFERPDPLNPNAAIVERTLPLSPTQSNSSGDNSASAPAINPMLLNAPGGGNPYLPPSLSGLGGGSQGAAIPSNLQGGPPGVSQTSTTVYNVTEPSAPATPTTVVVQPPTPPGPPPNTPPPVQINGGYGSGGLPQSGLGP